VAAAVVELDPLADPGWEPPPRIINLARVFSASFVLRWQLLDLTSARQPFQGSLHRWVVINGVLDSKLGAARCPPS